MGLRENWLNEVSIQIFPNPAQKAQTLKLPNKSPNRVQINLYDISGQKVMEVYNGLSVQGQQEFEVDVSHLPNGIYFYHFKVGEEWQYLKTVKH